MDMTIGITQDREALLLAITIERHNGQQFREWAMRFRPYDPSVSIFLEELALEELAHEQELLDTYNRHFNEKAPHGILFPDELIQLAKKLNAIKNHFFVINSHAAQSLLKMAIKIERYTQQFYLDLQAKTMDPELSAIYRILVEFENEHERILLERLEAEQINSIRHMASEKHYINEMQLT